MTNFASFEGQVRITGAAKATNDLGRLENQSRRTGQALKRKANETTRASDQLRRMGSSIAVLDGPLGGVASRFRSLGTLIGQAGFAAGALLIGFGSLSLVFRNWLANTIRQEQAEVMLQQAIRATGREAELSADRFVRLAQARQLVTAFGDEATIEAMGRLAQFDQISANMFERAIVAAQDFATATGTNLVTATNSLGIALQNPIEGLERLNRSTRAFTAADRDMIRQLQESGRLFEAQELILDRLNSRVEGAAEAFRDTFGGALRALGNAMGDLVEVTGGPLSAMTAMINAVTDNLQVLVMTFQVIAAMLVGRVAGAVLGFIAGKVAMKIATDNVVRANIAELQSLIALERATQARLGGMAAMTTYSNALAASKARLTALTNALDAAQRRAAASGTILSAVGRGMGTAFAFLGGWVGVAMGAIALIVLTFQRLRSVSDEVSASTQSITDAANRNVASVRDMNQMSRERIGLLIQENDRIRANIAAQRAAVVQNQEARRDLASGSNVLDRPFERTFFTMYNFLAEKAVRTELNALSQEDENLTMRNLAAEQARGRAFQRLRGEMSGFIELQRRSADLSEAEVNDFRRLLELRRTALADSQTSMSGGLQTQIDAADPETLERLRSSLARIFDLEPALVFQEMANRTDVMNEAFRQIDPAMATQLEQVTLTIGSLDEAMAALNARTEALHRAQRDFFSELHRGVIALETESRALTMTGDAAERYRLEQEMLTRARAAGIDTSEVSFLQNLAYWLERTLTLRTEIRKQNIASDAADNLSSDIERMTRSLQEQVSTFGMNEAALARYGAAALGVSDKLEPLIAQLEALRVAQERTGFLDALREEAETIGMTTAQLNRRRAAQMGVSEEAERYIRMIEAAENPTRVLESELDRMNATLREQIATFGMGRMELLAYQAAQAGATEETTKLIRELAQLNKEQENNNELTRQAEQVTRARENVFRSTRTPLEEYRLGISELNRLYGDSRPEEYDRAVLQLQQRFLDSQPAFAAARSSVGGFFSDIANGTGILDAAAGAMRRFLDSMIQQSVDQIFDVIGQKVFNLGIESVVDTAQEAAKGAAHGQASGVAIATAMTTSGLVTSKAFSTAIIGAGSVAAAQMAAAIAAAGTANTAGSILTKAVSLGSFAGGKSLGGVVMAGQNAIVGERGPEMIANQGNRTSIIPISNQNQNSGGVTISIGAIDAGGMSREEAEQLVFDAGRAAVNEAVKRSDQNTDQMFKRAFQQPRIVR